jgi:ABC-type tungstate transport system substrate-binding protein
MPWHVEDWLRRHIHTSSSLKRKPRRKTMLEMLTEASGLLIAGAILWAGREIHNAGIQVRRVSDAVESLDRRVSDLERVFSAQRVRESERRDSKLERDAESGSDSQGRS